MFFLLCITNANIALLDTKHYSHHANIALLDTQHYSHHANIALLDTENDTFVGANYALYFKYGVKLFIDIAFLKFTKIQVK